MCTSTHNSSCYRTDVPERVSKGWPSGQTAQIRADAVEWLEVTGESVCQDGDMSVRRSVCRLVSVPPAAAVALYIRRQRERLARDAVELAAEFTYELTPYFRPDVLDSTRLCVSEPLPIPDLPFSSPLRRCGLHIPSPSTIAAITFDNVIAAREPLPARVLFHELVHVVQYRLLGIDQFARQYVEGFLAEGSYDRIPLECCASLLEERFASHQTPFSVELAVASWSKQT